MDHQPSPLSHQFYSRIWKSNSSISWKCPNTAWFSNRTWEGEVEGWVAPARVSLFSLLGEPSWPNEGLVTSQRVSIPFEGPSCQAGELGNLAKSFNSFWGALLRQTWFKIVYHLTMLSIWQFLVSMKKISKKSQYNQ